MRQDAHPPADHSVIVASMKGIRLCVDCLTAKTSVPAVRVAEILERAQKIVRLAETAMTCGGCFRTLTVYGLGWRPLREREVGSEPL